LCCSTCWDGSNSASCYCLLLGQPSTFKLIIKTIPCFEFKIIQLNFKVMRFIINKKPKFRGPHFELLLSPF
jgi:hypothetical protein